MLPNDIITEKMDLSRENCNDIAALEAMDTLLRQSYGLSYEQYAELRNLLLVEYNYQLPVNILRIAITNKITIDLVSRGLLEVDSTVNNDLLFRVSNKGLRALHHAISNGSLRSYDSANSLYALLFLRNSNLLPQKEEPYEN